MQKNIIKIIWRFSLYQKIKRPRSLLSWEVKEVVIRLFEAGFSLINAGLSQSPCSISCGSTGCVSWWLFSSILMRKLFPKLNLPNFRPCSSALSCFLFCTLCTDYQCSRNFVWYSEREGFPDLLLWLIIFWGYFERGKNPWAASDVRSKCFSWDWLKYRPNIGSWRAGLDYRKLSS